MQQRDRLDRAAGRYTLFGLSIAAGLLAAGVNADTFVKQDSLERQSKRAGARHFHPERGEVSLDDLRRFSSTRKTTPHATLRLDPHLSIFVTDVETVSQIKLSEVMDKLVKESGDKTLTKWTLFRQWWDSAGQGPGWGLGPHCDDDLAPQPPAGIPNDDALSTLNNFPYRCPRLEATESTSDPFTDETDANPGAYSAIAYSNRFDLISKPTQITNPITGKTVIAWPDCGEFRVVFARNSGKKDPLNRNLIIFEARVPNPHPTAVETQGASSANAGPAGCKVILNFWHSLSNPSMSAHKRGELLKAFYLEGLPIGRHQKKEVGPVVSIANYTFNAGQIRSNQFMLNTVPPGQKAPQPGNWTLREFKTDPVNGTLAIVPDSVKSNPGDLLFKAAAAADARTSALNQSIRGQMTNLLGGAGAGKGLADVNSIGFNTGGEGVNSFESDERDSSLGDISVAFSDGAGPNPSVAANIQQGLTLNDSSLTPLNLVSRIKTQTCAGCHHWSDPGTGVVGGSNVNTDLGGGAIWPAKAAGDVGHPTHGLTHPPMDFTQESERDADLQPAIVGTQKRYATSLTVEKFLEFRQAFMQEALGLNDSQADINQSVGQGR